jgi:predicted ester cyclase
MAITGLIANEEMVAAHFRCSGAHPGQWQGHRPSGLRFWGVDEIYVYRMRGGRLAGAAGVEDNVARMRQLNTFRRQGGRNEAAARESRSPWLAG